MDLTTPMLLAATDLSLPFIPQWAEPGYALKPFIAELVLIATIVAVLIVPFFTRRSNVATALVSLVGIGLALVSLLFVQSNPDFGFQFRNLLVSDSFAVFWKILLLLFTGGVILMWFSTVGSTMHEGDGPEFFTLLLGATLGMCFMASTTNLLMIFLAVEMASLPSYVLAGFRKTDRIGSEASLKYVLFGAATSAVMAYGLSMLYGLYGTLQVEELARAMGQPGATVPVVLGVAGILAGIGFKISAVPFHFWCPDVFEGASIDVTTFLSVASKGAGLCLLFRILMSLAQGATPEGHGMLVGIAVAVGVVGAITATVGNTGALSQTNIKRLLAYSSIAHAGYMLCALSLVAAWHGTGGMTASEQVAQSILLYLAVYLFMNLGAFTVAGLVWKATGSESINDYAGLGRRNPVLALCMAAFMFSLIGLPPFAGFVAKFYVMYVLGTSGTWWWVLVVVIGVNTIASLYYYVRVLRVMYLTDSKEPALSLNPVGMALASACAVMLVLMLVAFNPVARLTGHYAKLHTKPATPAAAPTAPTTQPAVASADAPQVASSK